MTREQVAAWVVRTRAEQGLPRHVENDEVLTNVAQAIREPAIRDERALEQIRLVQGDDP